MKKLTIALLALALCGGLVIAGAIAMEGNLSNQKERASGQWRYKMTVTVETPEGEITGSAVREMGNATPRVNLPDVGNPADVRGEAVVVDMGDRGVLFALISHASDLEFYNTFPVPGHPIGVGGSSSAGIEYYSNLPVGTKAEMPSDFPPGYPKLVTFTDISDPKTVTLAQVWARQEQGLYTLKGGRMEELFGEGGELKSIELEITDEPVTWGVVDEYLPWLKDIKSNIDGTNITNSNELHNNLHKGNFKRD